ncbi:MAG: gamma-glutamyl-gamma-aminobutyrate hydrolase family protein [Vicinamibacterales bacterium]
MTRCSKLDDYLTSVERAGGRARILDVTESPRALIGLLDGLLLTGGGDVDPVLYGEDRHETIEDAEPGRDEFEIDLARRAVTEDLPLLAICRGAQVLNVASGGTLVQDIPSAVDTELTHAIRQEGNATAHAISVAHGSQLHRALGPVVDATCSCRVNSRHHQSISTIAPGLVATAAAPDGVVEAIESSDRTFCLGVQWHPENFWRTGEFDGLFTSFVSAARERMDNRG